MSAFNSSCSLRIPIQSKANDSNLTGNCLSVNKTPAKKPVFSRIQVFLTASLLSMSLNVSAESNYDRAVLNATKIVSVLHGVIPEALPSIVDKIATGKIKRLAPEQSIWILEVISGTILYYQGQNSFKDQAAAQLVDDSGLRFGTKALDFARASRGGWLSLTLGGVAYRAYCRSQYPFVACSMTR